MGIFKKFLARDEEQVNEMASKRNKTQVVQPKRQDGPMVIPAVYSKYAIGHQPHTTGTGIHRGKGRKTRSDEKRKALGGQE